MLAYLIENGVIFGLDLGENNLNYFCINNNKQKRSNRNLLTIETKENQNLKMGVY